MARFSTLGLAVAAGAVVVLGLLALWTLRMVLGLVVRTVELLGILVVGLLAAYVVLELVRGWRRAGGS